jgi:prevent-host-death family protein
MNVGIRALKDSLSAFVERARRGETVVITDRGVPVAEIQGLRPGGPTGELKDAVANGRLVYKRSWSGRRRRRASMLGEGKSASDYVTEQRR